LLFHEATIVFAKDGKPARFALHGRVPHVRSVYWSNQVQPIVPLEHGESPSVFLDWRWHPWIAPLQLGLERGIKWEL